MGERHPFAVTGLLLLQLQLLPLNQLQHKNLSQQPLVSALQTIVLSTWRNFHIQEIAISITSACQQTLRMYSILLLWTAKNTSSILTLIHVLTPISLEKYLSGRSLINEFIGIITIFD